MKCLSLMICLAISMMPVSVVAAPAPNFPKAIQGIWMSDDSEGQTQCRRYLAALKMDDADASEYLVGAEIINSTRWHSYAEYGEGNSYEILSLTKLNGPKWRFSARVFVDGAPDSEDSPPMISTVKLDQRKLTWQLESLGGQPVDSWDEHRYFRCAAVPSYLYAG
jgi:hypothetical protein